MSVKQLAGQTMWYGLSSIAARFINYLLTPYLTAKLSGPSYGEMSLVYAAIPFLSVIFTYGLETAYFRFMQNPDYKKDIYNTSIISIICSTVVFTAILLWSTGPLSHFIKLDEHPEFLQYSAIIIAFDTLCALPFAKLRQDSKPRKFAAIRITNILITIALTYYFISICPKLYAENPNSLFLLFYKPNNGVGYVILANLVASAATFFMLSKEFFSIKWEFNKVLWQQMMVYSLPLLVAGFGGIINETFDRIMLGWWVKAPNIDAAHMQVAIYSACYKLSILISLFIQGFRMGAEPFFFKQAQGQNPQRTYARVMKFFVITISVMFLFVVLYLDIWKEFIRNKALWAGLGVVPILLLANMFLGIYYNLSIWYKLGNKTKAGATITIVGAVITLIINYLFIPTYSYMACAWATFACYGSMMVISYVWGQKEYRIPYAWKKLVAYMVIAVLIYGLHQLLRNWVTNTYALFGVATILLGAYVAFILKVEKKEFQKMPVIGKYL